MSYFMLCYFLPIFYLARGCHQISSQHQLANPWHQIFHYQKKNKKRRKRKEKKKSNEKEEINIVITKTLVLLLLSLLLFSSSPLSSSFCYIPFLHPSSLFLSLLLSSFHVVYLGGNQEGERGGWDRCYLREGTNHLGSHALKQLN